MTRYVVIGAGAIGATIAAQLHLAGRRVVLVARGAHLAALRENGLRYLRPDGPHQLPLEAVSGPSELELAAGDVLLVATKSQDTEQVLQDWAWRPVKLADGGTAPASAVLPLVSLQNGLENERTALRRFDTVLGASVWLPATHLRPGEVVASAAPVVGALWLGRYPSGTHPRLAEIATDLAEAHLHVELTEDVRRWKAGKLLGNVANGLDALYAPSPLRDIAARALRREARAVLTAAGFDPAHLASHRLRELVKVRTVEGHYRGGSSTWQSLTRGGSSETDFLNGEIVLQAALLGQTAPDNAALARRVQRAAAEGTSAGSLDDADLAATLPGLARRDVLVTAPELHQLLVAGHPPTVLDVRWALGDPDGERHYRDGHLPGAVFVDLDSELTAPATALAGRHPLPDVAQLQSAARRWGVRAGSPVVIYDDNGGTSAARAWWLLRWAGVPDVRLLDGALGGWLAHGYPLATGPERPEPGDAELAAGRLPTLNADDAATLPDRGVLLDARAGERYRGEVEPVDPRAGHIPGAVSAPTWQNLAADGTFLSTELLRDRFAALGVGPAADADTPVGVYCGSGVTAAHEIAALAVAGIPAALYPGSWSQWSADPARPAATGPSPRSGDR